MEYIYYVLITLGILLVCLASMRRSRSTDLARKPTKRIEAAPKEKLRSHQALTRELKNVPTPWGWPTKDGAHRTRHFGSIQAEEVHDVSETLHNWADRLKSRKTDRNSEEYKTRCHESLRTMCEDRYGRSANPKPIKYKKVKPPLLRDPSEPHDQMDNFPSGKTKEITSKIKAQPRSTRQNIPPMRKAQLGGVRKPWGW